MLTIFNLHARVDDKEILKGVNLKVNAGEVHAIMANPVPHCKTTARVAVKGMAERRTSEAALEEYNHMGFRQER